MEIINSNNIASFQASINQDPDINSDALIGSSRTARRNRNRSRSRRKKREQLLAQHKWMDRFELPPNAVNSLLTILNGVVEGSDRPFITPIGMKHSPEVLMQGWTEIYESLDHEALTPTLIEIENQNKEKYGPRSIQKPWSERKGSVEEYFAVSELEPRLKEEIIKVAIDEGNKQNRQFRPVSRENALSHLKNQTNSGLPLMKAGKYAKQTPMDDLIAQEGMDYPCVLFTRTQEQGKTRNVWGFPFIWKLLEQEFYQVLLNHQRQLHWRAAILHPDAVDKEVTACIDKAIATGDQILSVDFSAYDASIVPDLQLAAFEYIKRLFRKEYWARIDSIAHNFGNIGIITPEGLREGPHGVPSGSTFTNEIDSIVQFIIQHLYKGIKNFNIQGDDGIYVVPSAAGLMEHFIKYGLEVNKSKSLVSDDGEGLYLQKYYHPKYRQENGVIGGIYSTYRALLRLVYQERFTQLEDSGITADDYYAIRSITIMENCKFHPYFEEFVKYMYDMDKRLGKEFDQITIDAYVRKISDSIGGRVMKNQYGDDISGIKQFEVYKLLRKLEQT
uniref:RdRp n=1 Tax=viral metagenome TaxID=1070528 RepID=A0A2V0R9D6_9ZZZZ